jgi:hypothetical protein
VPPISALNLPIALGGDSVSNNNNAIAVVGIVSIVGGYLVLMALWYFVFRHKKGAPDQLEVEPTPGPSTALRDGPPAPHTNGVVHDNGLRVGRERSGRFRRR